MFFFEESNPFWRGEAANEFELGRACLLEDIEGCAAAMSGCQHRIEEPNDIILEVRGQPFDVEIGFERFLVPGVAEVSDSGFGNNVLKSGHHTEGGTKDGNEGDPLFQLSAFGLLHRGLDFA